MSVSQRRDFGCPWIIETPARFLPDINHLEVTDAPNPDRPHLPNPLGPIHPPAMERLPEQQGRLEVAPTPPPHLACRYSPRPKPSLAKPPARRQPRPLNQRHCAVSHLSALLRSSNSRVALPPLAFQTPAAASPPGSYSFNPPSAAPREPRRYAWDAHSPSAIPRQSLGASTCRVLDTSLLESALSSLRLEDPRRSPPTQSSESSKVIIDVIHAQQVGGVACRPAVEHDTATCGPPPRSRPAGTYICAGGNGGYSGGGRGTDDDDLDDDGDDDGDYRRPAHNGEGSGFGPNDGEEDQAGGGDGDGTESRNANNRRAQAVSTGPLGCPYRKRNRQRFNVRNHPRCTKGFRDFSSLKSVHPSQHCPLAERLLMC